MSISIPYSSSLFPHLHTPSLCLSTETSTKFCPVSSKHLLLVCTLVFLLASSLYSSLLHHGCTLNCCWIWTCQKQFCTIFFFHKYLLKPCEMIYSVIKSTLISHKYCHYVIIEYRFSCNWKKSYLKWYIQYTDHTQL